MTPAIEATAANAGAANAAQTGADAVMRESAPGIVIPNTIQGGSMVLLVCTFPRSTPYMKRADQCAGNALIGPNATTEV